MENKKLYGLLCRLNRRLSRSNVCLFAESGITPVQMHAMVFVHKNTNRGVNVCQRDIEGELGLRPSSVSALISNLERGGFVTRSVAEGDARAKILTLTEKGERACTENKRAMDICDERLQSALTVKEQEELKRLLCKVLDSIDQ